METKRDKDGESMYISGLDPYDESNPLHCGRIFKYDCVFKLPLDKRQEVFEDLEAIGYDQFVFDDEFGTDTIAPYIYTDGDYAQYMMCSENNIVPDSSDVEFIECKTIKELLKYAACKE